LGYKIIHGASKLIALTSSEVNQYIKVGADKNKIFIVPNGIDIAEFNDLPTKKEFRIQYGINDDEKIILFVGRIHKIKGLDLLIDVMVDISLQLRNCRLVIAGPDDGYLSLIKSQIENLGIEDKVLFTGPLYGIDKICAYAAANVYVQPSLYELFPISVLEAIVCGVPVVLTDKCCNSDIVKDGLGIVVRRDKSEMMKAIVSILREDISVDQEAINNFKRQYNLTKIIDRVEILYDDSVRKTLAANH
jgi:glycosyltransferase involved in cell wall biosynthesis